MAAEYGLTVAWLDGQLVVSGECDIASAHMLLLSLEEHARNRDLIRVDVSGLAFCDSSCLAAFLQTIRAGKHVVLVRPHPALRKVIAQAGVDDFFEVED